MIFAIWKTAYFRQDFSVFVQAKFPTLPRFVYNVLYSAFRVAQQSFSEHFSLIFKWKRWIKTSEAGVSSSLMMERTSNFQIHSHKYIFEFWNSHWIPVHSVLHLYVFPWRHSYQVTGLVYFLCAVIRCDLLI